MGRFWQTSGPQQYTPDGALQQFTYDPYVISHHIVSGIAGNYMPLLASETLPGTVGIGALSYAATRPVFRRKYGHGRALVEAFEREILHLAAARGHTVTLFVLEANAAAVGFWGRCGYRRPENVYYAQPPIDFDEQTGDPLFPEVPEVLMVKIVNGNLGEIESDLLISVVKTIYQEWYLRRLETFTPVAAQRATSYVMDKVFQNFLVSLPQDHSSILLKPLSS